MVKRSLFFAVAVLGICIAFVLGTLLGWGLSTQKLSEATKILKNTELNTESLLLEQDLVKTLGQRSCGVAQQRINELGNQLYGLGNLLGSEKSSVELGVNYDVLKRQFHLLQIRTYTLNFQLQQECNESSPVVLFYYAKNNTASLEQGVILDELVKSHDARVYAIEHNYSQDLRFLEEYYNITQAPSVVVNYDKVFQGLTADDLIEESIGKGSSK
ncbi:MAG: hypothetical protein Q7K43_01970 [Candidatus Woesearchaeota archaeon]|nr:hypothetical protein [Candidatus Woesearchaeota archaeon]